MKFRKNIAAKSYELYVKIVRRRLQLNRMSTMKFQDEFAYIPRGNPVRFSKHTPHFSFGWKEDPQINRPKTSSEITEPANNDVGRGERANYYICSTDKVPNLAWEQLHGK